MNKTVLVVGYGNIGSKFAKEYLAYNKNCKINLKEN